MATAISVEGVSKSYRLGTIGGATLKEDFSRVWAKWRGKPNPLLQVGEENHARLMGEQFWALRDVSFKVSEGRVLGVIGRNGAGKSTLLKVLSQVTSPTSGEIKIRGRIASLLEVGTGFHPELTGRENIFLNGAILGMTKGEIRRKFDEIVAFSGVEEFIDTPVKRYSSGMYVRLAFAVAAHLEPEILIVDEVLAVGDAQFQKKCLGKMEQVSKGEGRTVLFVSHNMGAINFLCSEVVLLHNGSVRMQGPTAEITRHYFDSGEAASSCWERSKPIDPAAEGIFLLGVRVLVDDHLAPPQIMTNQNFVVEVRIRAQADYRDAELAVRFTNQEGIPVLSTANGDMFGEFQKIARGQHTFRVSVPKYLLAEGTYSLLVAALVPGRILFDSIDGLVKVSIQELGPQASVMRDGRLGVVNPRLHWEIVSSKTRSADHVHLKSGE